MGPHTVMHPRKKKRVVCSHLSFLEHADYPNEMYNFKLILDQMKHAIS